MDSDVIFVVISLCDCLKVYHYKTSNNLEALVKLDAVKVTGRK